MASVNDKDKKITFIDITDNKEEDNDLIEMVEKEGSNRVYVDWNHLRTRLYRNGFVISSIEKVTLNILDDDCDDSGQVRFENIVMYAFTEIEIPGYLKSIKTRDNRYYPGTAILFEWLRNAAELGVLPYTDLKLHATLYKDIQIIEDLLAHFLPEMSYELNNKVITFDLKDIAALYLK